MTWSIPQTGFTNNTSGSSFAASLTNPVASGSIIAGAWVGDVSFTITGVSDDQGNTYFTKQTLTVAGIKSTIFYRGNLTNGPKTVTVNTSGGPNNAFLVLCEIQGGALLPDPSDGSAGQSLPSVSGSVDGATSGAVNTTVDGDLIFGMIGEATSATPGTPGTGYTGIVSAIFTAGHESVNTEYIVQNVHGAKAATFTVTNGDNVTVAAVAFQPPPPPVTGTQAFVFRVL